MITDAPTKKGKRVIRVGPAAVLIGDPTVPNGKGMMPLGQIQSTEIQLNISKAMGSIVGGHQLASATFDRSVSPVVTVSMNDTQQSIMAMMLDNAYRPHEEVAITAVDDAANTVTVSGDYSAESGAGFSVEPNEVVTLVDRTEEGSARVTQVAYDDVEDETTFTLSEDDPLSDSTVEGSVLVFSRGMLFRTDMTKAATHTMCVVPIGKEQDAINQSGVFWFPAVTATETDAIVYDDTEGEDANTEQGYTLQSLYREYDQSGALIHRDARQMFTVPPSQIPGETLTWSLPADILG